MAPRKIHSKEQAEQVQMQPEATGPLRHSSVARSLRSDLTLSSIRMYIGSCERTLGGIRSSIVLLNAHPDDRAILRQITEKLSNICLSADAWGFEDPCRIAAQMLRLLLDLDSGTLRWNGRMVKILDGGLSLLLNLLRECENSYRREFAIADLLSSLSTTGTSWRAHGSLYSL